MSKMKYGEMVKLAAGKSGLTAAQVDRALKGARDVVIESLKAGGESVSYGIGVFKRQTLKAGQRRNPFSGETMQVPERQKVKFTPGKVLKSALN